MPVSSGLVPAVLVYQSFHVLPHYSTFPHIDPACSGLALAVLGYLHIPNIPRPSLTFPYCSCLLLFTLAVLRIPRCSELSPVVPGPSAMPNYPRLSQAFPDCSALLEVFRAVPGCSGITCASMGCTRLPTVIPGNASTSPCPKLLHIPPCPDGLFRARTRWSVRALTSHAFPS